MNKYQFKTEQQVDAVVNFILWNYDVNCATLADKHPIVIVSEHKPEIWKVKIEYLCDIIPGRRPLLDPTTHEDDRPVMAEESFYFSASEGFSALEKRVTDICDVIAEVKIDA